MGLHGPHHTMRLHATLFIVSVYISVLAGVRGQYVKDAVITDVPAYQGIGSRGMWKYFSKELVISENNIIALAIGANGKSITKYNVTLKSFQTRTTPAPGLVFEQIEPFNSSTWVIRTTTCMYLYNLSSSALVEHLGVCGESSPSSKGSQYNDLRSIAGDPINELELFLDFATDMENKKIYLALKTIGYPKLAVWTEAEGVIGLSLDLGSVTLIEFLPEHNWLFVLSEPKALNYIDFNTTQDEVTNIPLNGFGENMNMKSPKWRGKMKEEIGKRRQKRAVAPIKNVQLKDVSVLTWSHPDPNRIKDYLIFCQEPCETRDDVEFALRQTRNITVIENSVDLMQSLPLNTRQRYTLIIYGRTFTGLETSPITKSIFLSGTLAPTNLRFDNFTMLSADVDVFHDQPRGLELVCIPGCDGKDNDIEDRSKRPFGISRTRRFTLNVVRRSAMVVGRTYSVQLAVRTIFGDRYLSEAISIRPKVKVIISPGSTAAVIRDVYKLEVQYTASVDSFPSFVTVASSSTTLNQTFPIEKKQIVTLQLSDDYMSHGYFKFDLEQAYDIMVSFSNIDREVEFATIVNAKYEERTTRITQVVVRTPRRTRANVNNRPRERTTSRTTPSVPFMLDADIIALIIGGVVIILAASLSTFVLISYSKKRKRMREKRTRDKVKREELTAAREAAGMEEPVYVDEYVDEYVYDEEYFRNGNTNYYYYDDTPTQYESKIDPNATRGKILMDPVKTESIQDSPNRVMVAPSSINQFAVRASFPAVSSHQYAVSQYYPSIVYPSRTPQMSMGARMSFVPTQSLDYPAPQMSTMHPY